MAKRKSPRECVKTGREIRSTGNLEQAKDGKKSGVFTDIGLLSAQQAHVYDHTRKEIVNGLGGIEANPIYKSVFSVKNIGRITTKLLKQCVLEGDTPKNALERFEQSLTDMITQKRRKISKTKS